MLKDREQMHIFLITIYMSSVRVRQAPNNRPVHTSQSQQWILLEALICLLAKLVLTQQDLWSPCYKHQTVVRESQLIRSNDSTLWSAVSCQIDGCHSFFVSSGFKSVGNKARQEGWGFPCLHLFLFFLVLIDLSPLQFWVIMSVWFWFGQRHLLLFFWGILEWCLNQFHCKPQRSS